MIMARTLKIRMAVVRTHRIIARIRLVKGTNTKYSRRRETQHREPDASNMY